MIVKIVQENGAIMYDGFEKIRYERQLSKDVITLDTDASWFDENTKSDTTLVIIARKKNNQEFSIKTTCPTFLLNDEGKTIEKIN